MDIAWSWNIFSSHFFCLMLKKQLIHFRWLVSGSNTDIILSSRLLKKKKNRTLTSMPSLILHIFAYFVHINAYECKGEILMGSLHLYASLCIFMHLYAYLKLHISAYLSLCILLYIEHIWAYKTHIYAYHVFWKCIFMHIWFCIFVHILCIFMHMVLFAYVCIFGFCIFFHIYAY